MFRNDVTFVLYSSPDTVRMIKSRRTRWAVHVARMGERRGEIEFRWGNPRERDHLGDLDVTGRIILTFWNRNFTFKF